MIPLLIAFSGYIEPAKLFSPDCDFSQNSSPIMLAYLSNALCALGLKNFGSPILLCLCWTLSCLFDNFMISPTVDFRIFHYFPKFCMDLPPRLRFLMISFNFMLVATPRSILFSTINEQWNWDEKNSTLHCLLLLFSELMLSLW